VVHVGLDFYAVVNAMDIDPKHWLYAIYVYLDDCIRICHMNDNCLCFAIHRLDMNNVVLYTIDTRD